MAAPSQQEKKLLIEFRQRLKDLQLEGDQNSDMFLLRWIRARENKLELSEEMLRKSLKWRKDNGIDSILSWNAPKLVKDLVRLEAVGWDKKNHPLIIVPFGRWDIRFVADSGNKDEYVRYSCQAWEMMLHRMKGKITNEGVPVTQMTIIVDLEGLGMKCVGSREVLQGLKQVTAEFDSNYPEILHHSYVINASWIFSFIWRVIKPLLSERTTDKIELFTSSDKWKPVLLNAIAPDQLPRFYGGTRDSHLHPFLE